MPPGSVWESRFEKPNGNAQSNTGAPERTLVIRDWPGIALQRLENTSELELALLHRHEEASGTVGSLGERLSWARSSA